MASRIVVALRVDAPIDRAFVVFTDEIGQWWRPNDLFEFVTGKQGSLAFVPGPGGRLVERFADGSEFEIGRITLSPNRGAVRMAPGGLQPRPGDRGGRSL